MQGRDDSLVGPPDMSQNEVGRPRASPLVKLTQRWWNFSAFRPAVVVDGRATLYRDRIQIFLSCSPLPVGRWTSLDGA